MLGFDLRSLSLNMTRLLGLVLSMFGFRSSRSIMHRRGLVFNFVPIAMLLFIGVSMPISTIIVAVARVLSMSVAFSIEVSIDIVHPQFMVLPWSLIHDFFNSSLGLGL